MKLKNIIALVLILSLSLTLCACGEPEKEYGDWVSNGNGTHSKTNLADENDKITENCSGGTATCDSAAVCKDCNAAYGEPLGHDYEYTSNGDGTHTVTCKNDATHTFSENCSGGTATTTDKAVCEKCNTAYGSTLPETPEDPEDPEDPENPEVVYGAWVSNGDGTHTKTNVADATDKVTESCSGGTATCDNAAVCKDCNTAYGEALGHDYVYTSNGDGTHTLTCKNDATHTSSASCSGGKATCDDAAVCKDCNTAYGEALGHDYEYTSNGDNTHTATCKNDATHTHRENCSGGTPTNTSKPVCDKCNEEYGKTLGGSVQDGVIVTPEVPVT